MQTADSAMAIRNLMMKCSGTTTSKPKITETKNSPTGIIRTVRRAETLRGDVVELRRPSVVCGGPPQTPPEVNRLEKGVTRLENRADSEGHSILKSNGFRCKRPNGRPRKSRGHGTNHLLLVDIGAKLRDKKLPKVTGPDKPVSVPDKPIPSFVLKLLRARPECDFQKGLLRPSDIPTHFSSTNLSR